jgi:hypothetical protein
MAPIERRKPRIQHVSLGVFAPILAALLLAAGCGSEDDATSTERTASSDPITVGAFLAELRPQKQAILDTLVADTAACKGVEVDPGFVLLISAEAIDADPDSPLAELVEKQC